MSRSPSKFPPQLHLKFTDFPIGDPKEKTPHNIPLLLPIAGDASDKVFYRLVNYNLQLICMRFQDWSSGFGGDPENWLEMQKALVGMGLPVPYVVSIDKENFCLWIHDLGDEFLSAKIPGQKLTKTTENKDAIIELYRKSLDLLIQAQYPEQSIPHPGLERYFDTDKLMAELLFFVEHFFHNLLQLPIALEHPQDSKLFQELRNLAELLDKRPRVLCHRDYHSRNILLKNDNPFWIDFQDARMGPHTYDVVSLLRDSYVDISWEIRLELFAYYKDQLHKKRASLNLSPISEEELDSEFALMGLQRNLKVIGSYAYLGLAKGKKRFLEYIKPTLETLLSQEAIKIGDETLPSQFPKIFALLNDILVGTEEISLEKALARIAG